MSTAKSIMTSLKVSLRALTLIFVLISTISYFTALILGPILFFSTSDGLAAAAQRIHGLYVLLFMIFDVPVQLETSLGILFVLIWAVFFVCMILAWFDRGGYLNSTKGALVNPISLAKTNFLYIMPLVASALLSDHNNLAIPGIPRSSNRQHKFPHNQSLRNIDRAFSCSAPGGIWFPNHVDRTNRGYPSNDYLLEGS